jgi:hypothetical protein
MDTPDPAYDPPPNCPPLCAHIYTYTQVPDFQWFTRPQLTTINQNLIMGNASTQVVRSTDVPSPTGSDKEKL